MLATENPANIRSYVFRQGRMTIAQKRGLESLWKQYGITADNRNWEAVFVRHAPLALEIGCGYGEATAHLARHYPQYNYVALEVYPPALGALLNKLAAAQIDNVRVIRADAAEVLLSMFEDSQLYCARIFFPDPWQKRKHHKRRLINAAFARLLAQKIMRGGYIHCATDWADYAKQMRAVFAACDNFAIADKSHYPPRPPTRFAGRAAVAGRAVSDLFYTRL